jgi:hypothetical protein
VDRDDQNYYGYDGKQEQPDHVVRPEPAQARQLAFPGRYEPMGHMHLADMPADKTGNYQRNYRYPHGSASPRPGVTVIHNVIRKIIRFLRAGGVRFNAC